MSPLRKAALSIVCFFAVCFAITALIVAIAMFEVVMKGAALPNDLIAFVVALVILAVSLSTVVKLGPNWLQTPRQSIPVQQVGNEAQPANYEVEMVRMPELQRNIPVSFEQNPESRAEGETTMTIGYELTPDDVRRGEFYRLKKDAKVTGGMVIGVFIVLIATTALFFNYLISGANDIYFMIFVPLFMIALLYYVLFPYSHLYTTLPIINRLSQRKRDFFQRLSGRYEIRLTQDALICNHNGVTEKTPWTSVIKIEYFDDSIRICLFEEKSTVVPEFISISRKIFIDIPLASKDQKEQQDFIRAVQERYIAAKTSSQPPQPQSVTIEHTTIAGDALKKNDKSLSNNLFSAATFVVVMLVVLANYVNNLSVLGVSVIIIASVVVLVFFLHKKH